MRIFRRRWFWIVTGVVIAIVLCPVARHYAPPVLGTVAAKRDLARGKRILKVGGPPLRYFDEMIRSRYAVEVEWRSCCFEPRRLEYDMAYNSVMSDALEQELHKDESAIVDECWKDGHFLRLLDCKVDTIQEAAPVFRQAGATDPEHASTFEALGMAISERQADLLTDLAVLIRCEDERYYLDESAASEALEDFATQKAEVLAGRAAQKKPDLSTRLQP